MRIKMLELVKPNFYYGAEIGFADDRSLRLHPLPYLNPNT
jgi:hypothetical protein